MGPLDEAGVGPHNPSVSWDKLRAISAIAAADLAVLVAEWEQPGTYDQPRYSEARHKCQERMVYHLERLRRVKQPERATAAEAEQFLQLVAKLDAAMDWEPRGPRFCRLRLDELEALADDLRASGGGRHD